ncbi:MAG: virulence RhuM family protein [Bacilli bacterium]
MSKNKRKEINLMKKNDITIRSSAAEYLTFIAATGDDKESIEMRYEDENIWLTQKMLSSLYDVSIAAINQHIKKIYEDNELLEDATIKKYLIVQNEGNREINRLVNHYNLQMIIAVGFKINNEKAIQFRKWANQIVKDYTIKGWVMDSDRLKNGGSILTEKYFEEQLEKIREIRLSERKFYQKVTDIYATSIDYDSTAKATQRFFTAIQNKLHYAIHGQTAAEVIYDRANSKKDNMGLTNWTGAPNSKIHKYDITIAKNYLTKDEIYKLERVVSAYLDLAEVQAKKHIPMTMNDWEERLNRFLTVWDHEILKNNGKISNELAKIHAETEFEKYRIIQDKLYKSDFDLLLEETENK